MTDTLIRLALGSVGLTLYPARPLRHLSAGLYVPANLRGVMGAGLAGEVRVRAGREVEDELLRLRPLSLGRAYRTNPGNLAAAGVEVLAHAVTSDSPGETAKPGQSDRALRAALELFDDAGIRAVTLPLVEVAPGDPASEKQGQAFGQLLTGHLRRRSRIRQVNVAGLDHHFLAGLEAYLRNAGALPIDD
ncbi:hypothetical protein BH23CHL2_BH23CHL2_23780 [soil metagenome]